MVELQAGQKFESHDDSGENGYRVVRAEVFVGRGGIAGTGHSSPEALSKEPLLSHEPVVTLRCDLCDWEEDEVPVSRQGAWRFQHVRREHPEQFQRGPYVWLEVTHDERRRWRS